MNRRGTLINYLISTIANNVGPMCHIYALHMRTDAVILTPGSSRLFHALLCIESGISIIYILICIFPIIDPSLVGPYISGTFFLSGYWPVSINLSATMGAIDHFNRHTVWQAFTCALHVRYKV